MLKHNRALEAMLVATTVASGLGGIVIAHSVGPSGRGVVGIVTVWGQVLGWLAVFSLDRALVVLSSGERAPVSPDEALRVTRLPVIGTSCLVVLACVLLGHHFFSSNWLVLSLAAVAVATAQAELVGAWLLARGRREMYILWRLLQPVLYVTLIIFAAGTLRSSSNQERTIVIGLAAAMSVVLPVLFALARLLRRPLVAKRGLGAFLKFASAAQVATILQYLNGRLDFLVLTFLVSAESLGYYAAGAAAGQVVVLTAGAAVIRGMTGEAKSADLVGIGIASILAAIVLVAAPFLIPFAFGAPFQAAVPIGRILAVGGVANYALQAASGRLLGRRHPWLVAICQGSGVVVFAIGILTFPTVYGAAWSSVVSYIVSLVVAQLFLRLVEPDGVGQPPDGSQRSGRK